MTTSTRLRQQYLDFFKARGHAVCASTPLIPQGDATLMFNSAGMVPFKPYFLGLKKDLSRAASCQKCFRTTDIDRVGLTLRHLTFFEMLGNFSFGDYFKAEAIPWAWEFLTKDCAIDPALLHPTVFKDDAQAEALWKKQSLKNPVRRLGEDTNFWAMGPTGPCGPCSEIYVDRGPEFGCSSPSCAPGCDCDRYLEVWNLVFTQFDRQGDGSLKPLPRQNIDTGMGLERLALVAQGRTSPFDTDLFSPITDQAAALLKTEPGRSPETALAFRVIADHARAAAMLMSEGIIPSNVERGYVLRRLIRRAVRYGQLLGCAEPFLYKLVPAVLDVFRGTYPDILKAEAIVASGLKMEESRFIETLAAGERELKAVLEKTSGTLAGAQAFKLYDTFGFPLELTKEICGQRGLKVDEEGFAKAKEDAAEVARASWKGSGEKDFLAEGLGSHQSEFTGYASLSERTKVLAARFKGGEGIVVLERSPFYAESGGQVGDTGEMRSADGRSVLAEVIDTQKHEKTTVLMVKGAGLKPGDEVLAEVDAARRRRIMPHHTATHLLNQALRMVLGVQVRQAGSYVDDKRLRFDFTHPKALSAEELHRIEGIVNEEIRKALPVETREMPPAEAVAHGAVTLLGEDYGYQARAVLVGSKGWKSPHERFSLELCGGTHVSNTAEIEAFKIVKESSVAAGIRRIEAVAGPAASEYVTRKAEAHKAAMAALVAKQDALLKDIRALGGEAGPCPEREESSLRSHLKNLENSLTGLKAKKLSGSTAGRKVLETKGIKLCVQKLEGADPKSLRGVSDKVKSELGSGAVFLAAAHAGKLSFVLAATPDLAGKGFDAGSLAKKFAAAHGGSAGGRADFAQGGVPDSDWDQLVASLSGLL
ncbi:MAG: alanine--tRNA ligase [Elusimicrobia bacterium]|nr:alanine--tRNA ligase [Elusimicrobiota bacterium]